MCVIGNIGHYRYIMHHYMCIVFQNLIHRAILYKHKRELYVSKVSQTYVHCAIFVSLCNVSQECQILHLCDIFD